MRSFDRHDRTARHCRSPVVERLGIDDDEYAHYRHDYHVRRNDELGFESETRLLLGLVFGAVFCRVILGNVAFSRRSFVSGGLSRTCRTRRGQPVVKILAGK